MIAHLPARTALGGALTLPVTVLAMGSHLPGLPEALRHSLSGPVSVAVQAVLTTLVVFGCGLPLLTRGIRSWTRRLTMFTLISLGVLVTYGYSLAAWLIPGAFPDTFHGPHGVPVYFEAAAMITVLVLAGQWMEKAAQNRTGSAIRSLAALAPATAIRIRDGIEEDIPADAIRIGDRLRIRPGGAVPADGILIEGEAYLDESMLTGEPAPRAVGSGDRVVAGVHNISGSLVLEVEQTGDHTVLARIIRRVRQAQDTRAPIERIADRVTGWVVPSVLVIAALTFAVWAAVGPEPRLLYALISAVTVLMITCPCALGLATPMSIVVGMGRGATGGILIRNAEILERLQQLDTVVFDKTGTLTEGAPSLVAIKPSGETGEADLLSLAAAVEAHSEHPYGQAVVAAARERSLSLPVASRFRSITGHGVEAEVDGRLIRVGKPTTAQTTGSDRPDQAATVIEVIRDDQVLGTLILADPVRPTAATAVAALRSLGRASVLLTGDAEPAARQVARAVGIETVYAGVLPDRKQDRIRALQAEGRTVAMVGDGINDAPALAAADIGIAMGSGTDIALETADIALLENDPARVADAIRLGQAVLRNIRQNLAFAFAYNLLGIPIAAGVLYPFTGLLLSPMLASLAMTLSSVSVITNALRLRRLKL